MTDETNFQDYIASERERLNAERDRWQKVKNEADGHLVEIDREFAAIDAYEAAKTGAPAKTQRPIRVDADGNRVSVARRGSRREAILQAVQAAPNGMSRGELLEACGLKGDKSGEMSISNALTALTKSGQLEREGGKYFAPVGRGDTVSALREAAE